MAYTTIDDPSAHFHTRLYSGNNSGSGLAVTNNANSGNFQPDWVWIKRRDSAADTGLHDSNRGSTKRLKSSAQDAEDTNSNILSSFDSNGFTIGDNSAHYNASGTYVAWQWKANGGSRTTFTESGNNPGGGYQANTTAGFSIVDYTGTGGAGTVQHGLGAVPELIIFKDRGDSSNWLVYTEPTGNTHTLFLNRNVAKEDDNTLYNDTTPTSSVFTVGTHNDINANDDTYIAYCFTSIKGYSKIGSYTGNGNADGPFVYTGFKPAWWLGKKVDSAENWFLVDNARHTINDGNIPRVIPNNTDAESEDASIAGDFLSNGFKIRATQNMINTNGGTYLYMAFAEHPFVSSKGVPVTAR
jgi:hypothetical protein